MLDYLLAKRFYADKLRDDSDGLGRVESAFYHTIEMAYLKGVEDGKEAREIGIVDHPAKEC